MLIPSFLIISASLEVVFKDCKRVFALKRQGKVFDAEAFKAVFKPSALRGDISAVSVLHQSFGNLHRSKFNPPAQFGQNLQHDRVQRSRGGADVFRAAEEPEGCSAF